MFKTILMSFDGSGPSVAALAVALDLAQTYGAALHIVHVTDAAQGSTSADTDVFFAPAEALIHKSHAEDLQEQSQIVLHQARVIVGRTEATNVTTTLLTGAPDDAILKHADAIGADLIVAGRRGLGTLRGLLMGSVSSRLTAHARCPVMTVA
ncbi:Nucleotide-binding universal stress protein, UspA family [Loktanella fryxellensis]|uniref:Nucleotide-binding universal stress protein, UspA family n=1 Tax=Loktanella fryxellensis TaxID=245187 RepID=A0A1H8FWD7_9RHOB|nr:universal stress protein [Loktanella fryxellensis]SEN35844.1 Nucleotide-binding universal stress protein, UspA family [Loktanella fryxellensis]